MFCIHRYNKIENNYQYCKKCGIARVVLCAHVWQAKDKIITKFVWQKKFMETGYVLQCKKCGEIKKVAI